MVMVGMTSLPVGKNDGLRPELTDHGGEPEFVLARGLNVRIGHTKSAAPFHAKKFGRVRRFFCTRFRSAASAHFSRGQIEDPGLITALRHLEERAAAGQFNVVGMRGD